MKTKSPSLPLNILLADDDKDDRFFFEKALHELPLVTNLTTIIDGEQLMNYLSENSGKLPDVLFLDLNMPRINGAECLEKIKSDQKLKQLPVVIYSTSLNNLLADTVYKKGAHYYLHKRNYDELKKTLGQLLAVMIENKFARPERDTFVFNPPNAYI